MSSSPKSHDHTRVVVAPQTQALHCNGGILRVPWGLLGHILGGRSHVHQKISYQSGSEAYGPAAPTSDDCSMLRGPWPYIVLISKTIWPHTSCCRSTITSAALRLMRMCSRPNVRHTGCGRLPCRAKTISSAYYVGVVAEIINGLRCCRRPLRRCVALLPRVLFKSCSVRISRRSTPRGPIPREIRPRGTFPGGIARLHAPPVNFSFDL